MDDNLDGDRDMNAQLDRMELNLNHLQMKLDNLLNHLAFGTQQQVSKTEEVADVSEAKDHGKLETLTTKQVELVHL